MSKKVANSTLNGRMTKESARMKAYAERRHLPLANNSHTRRDGGVFARNQGLRKSGNKNSAQRLGNEHNYRMSKLVSTVAMEGGGPIPDHELDLQTRNSALDMPSDQSLDSSRVSLRAQTRGHTSRRNFGVLNSSATRTSTEKDKKLNTSQTGSRTSL